MAFGELLQRAKQAIFERRVEGRRPQRADGDRPSLLAKQNVAVQTAVERTLAPRSHGLATLVAPGVDEASFDGASIAIREHMRSLHDAGKIVWIDFSPTADYSVEINGRLRQLHGQGVSQTSWLAPGVAPEARETAKLVQGLVDQGKISPERPLVVTHLGYEPARSARQLQNFYALALDLKGTPARDSLRLLHSTRFEPGTMEGAFVRASGLDYRWI
jgi:hypothetical protein